MNLFDIAYYLNDVYFKNINMHLHAGFFFNCFYLTKIHRGPVWQYGLWSFQTGGTKLEIFLDKNQHTQRKLLNFENWFSGEVSKSAKI